MDITPEPDLHPLYPSTAHVAVSLSSHSGLTPSQKSKLVQHCLTRACLFADISLLQYLLSDSSAQPHVDLSLRDDEGIGLVSLTIHGFGGDSDRDLDREEVVRLLVSQGADLKPDAGKTLLSTLIRTDVDSSCIMHSRMDTFASRSFVVAANASLLLDDPWVFSI